MKTNVMSFYSNRITLLAALLTLLIVLFMSLPAYSRSPLPFFGVCLEDYAYQEGYVAVSVGYSGKCGRTSEFASLYKSNVVIYENLLPPNMSVDGFSELLLQEIKQSSWTFEPATTSDETDSLVRPSGYNKINYRSVNTVGDSYCYKLSPLPAGYVVTGQSFTRACGGFTSRYQNTAHIHAPYSGITACRGFPIPDGYEVESYVSNYTACGGVQFTEEYFNNNDARVNDNAVRLVKSAADTGINLMGNDWFQIQSQPFYVEVYQGRGDKFVKLQPGTYTVINLTRGGIREENIIVR